MRDTLRLKGDKHSNGETVEFTIAEVSFINQRCGDWWIEQDGCVHVIDPATIHAADDPRNQMLEAIRVKVENMPTYHPILSVSHSDTVATIQMIEDEEGSNFISGADVLTILDEMEADL